MYILVVGDDPFVAVIPGMILQEAGYFKTTANTSETVLFELKHSQIDAVLPNINLPDEDGTRLARLIRKNHMPAPILVVSGNSGIDGLEPKIIDVFMCKLPPKIADAGTSGVVINTIWGQAHILREMRDHEAMTISAWPQVPQRINIWKNLQSIAQ